MAYKSDEQKRQYQNRYYRENKVTLLAKRKRFYDKNRLKVAADQRRRYRENPKRYLNYRLKGKYGISVAEYEARVALQDGICPICREKPERLVIDHSHETGEVRGLICGNCNTGLGMFRDSPENLKAAISYLEMAQRAMDGRSDSRQRAKRGRFPRPNL